MPRLIDADALMEILGITDIECDKCAWGDKERSCCKRGGDFADACFAIYSAPTIEERKKGKWIDAVIPNDNGGLLVQVCDQCNTFFPLEYTGGGHHYCPNCGADMRGEGNGNE